MTVTVEPVLDDNRLYGTNGLIEKEVTISQTYSCKSACQWETEETGS